MNERAFQSNVVDLAKLQHWEAYHTFDSRRSEPGFPDLVLAHASRGLLFRELKTETGQLTKAQVRWLAVLMAAIETGNVSAGVWRPSDMDRINLILAGKQ